uniref:Uncharacterized protein n=1 Tax=Psilocybe cubensis TaxID=181762 RepID=A0A8H7XQ88_PSICU
MAVTVLSDPTDLAVTLRLLMKLAAAIGSVCRVQDTSDVVKCINEFGETQSAIPSSTTGFLPSVTPVTKDALLHE